MARLHTGRHKVLSTYRSYHGSRPPPRSPRPVTHGAGRTSRPPSAWCTSGARTRTARPSTPRRGSRSPSGRWQHLRDTIVFEGAGTVAAVLLETVVGTNGVLVPPPGYLEGVRAICDEFGIVLIADEVMAGFGRCGEWFAVDRWRRARPTSSPSPRASTPATCRWAESSSPTRSRRRSGSGSFPGGLTYSGHPLACASAVASIQIFKEEGIIEHARQHRRGRDRTRRCRSSRDAIRAWARSAGWACSGRSSWSATGRPASRSCRSTPPAQRPRR